MSNKAWFMNALQSSQIENASGGRIKRLNKMQASGMIGSWIVETGDPTLQNIDVVERGNGGAGRGLSQYTGVRRQGYDRARAQALRNGQDVNSREWQFQYFVDEYLGKHDINGASMIGWTRSLENIPEMSSAADYAQYFTDQYFRPGTPHMERRRQLANETFGGASDDVIDPSGSSAQPQPDFGSVQTIDQPKDMGQLIKDAVGGLGINL